jgi:hypothetical protein
MIIKIKNIPTPFAAIMDGIVKFFSTEKSCDEFLFANPSGWKAVQDNRGDLILYATAE